MVIWVSKIYFFCVFSPVLNILFLLGPYHVCPLLCAHHLCMKCSLGISNFLEEISSFSHSLFSSISLHFSLRKTFYSLFDILRNSAFRRVYLSFSPLHFASLRFSAACKASSDSHFAFLNSFFLGMLLITTSRTMSRTSIHSSSGTLSGLIPWIYFSVPLYNHKGFDLGHSLMA